MWWKLPLQSDVTSAIELWAIFVVFGAKTEMVYVFYLNYTDSSDDVISSRVLQQQQQEQSMSRYSRVSVDEMDVEKMFDKTCEGESVEALEAPLSPTDYTLQLDDDDELSADTTATTWLFTNVVDSLARGQLKRAYK
jgi:hypothetical protein